MTDKELLELAAKAAGIKLLQGYGEPQWRCMFYQDSEGNCHDWNPLTDDGDALRLAVKLVDKQGEMLLAWMDGRIDFGDTIMKYASEEITDDPYAATRRAIVRAAAEIGKSL